MAPLRVGLWLSAAEEASDPFAEALTAAMAAEPGLDQPWIILDRRRAIRPAGQVPEAVLSFDAAMFARRGRHGGLRSAADRSIVVGEAHRDGLETEDVERIAVERLDVIVKLAGTAPDPDVLGAARAGVWTYNFIADAAGGDPWLGMREALARRPTTPVRLERIEPEGRSVLDEGRCATKFSAARTRAMVEDKAVALTLKQLRGLNAGAGLPAASAVSERRAVEPVSGLAYGARLGAAFAGKALARARARLGLAPPQFRLFLGSGEVLADGLRGRPLPLARGEFHADPFLLRRDGALYVFYEAFGTDRKGRICAARIEGKGKITPLGDALCTEHHLSYPFVFEHEGETYMIPERHQARRVEVWRCRRFPHEWELCATALEGLSAVDSTLFRHEGRWWLFANIARGGVVDHCTELELFEVDGPLLKDLRPHRANPVVVDATSARGAGRIFVRGGRVFRPSQDNTGDVYGFGLNIMEIVRLDSSSYVERRVRFFEGSHHLDAGEGVFIFDARPGRFGFEG